MSGDSSYSSACATCAAYVKRSKSVLLSFFHYPEAWSLDQDLLSRALNTKEEEVVKLLFEHRDKVQLDEDDNINVKSKKTLLHCAVETNDIEITKLLLRKNVDIEERSHDDSTPLHIAARMGNTDIAEILLNYGADVNSVCVSTLGALLHVAVKQRKVALVEMLLRKGTKMNATVKDEGALLVLAAKRRCLKLVKVLLNNGADIDARDKDDENIVHFAVAIRNLALIELLLEANCDPENNPGCFHAAVQGSTSEPRSKILEALVRYGFGLSFESPTDSGLLYTAVCRGYSKIVEYLLNSGTNFNAESTAENGAMPLHAAVQYNQIEIARLLIKNNANVNAKDKSGNTPMHYALRNFNVDITKLLLAHGADLKGEPNVVHKATLTMSKDFVEMLFLHEPTLNVNSTNRLGMSVLYRSVIVSRYIRPRITDTKKHIDTCIRDIVAILLEKGADVDARAKNGTTALHVAAQQGYQKVVELLLEHKADVNAVDKEGETPLHYLARNGYENIVKILLNAGAKVDAMRTNGATALHIAIERGHVNAVKLLVESGADVAGRNKNGSTSLHIAAWHRSTEVLEILLNVSEDVNCRARGGITALHIAAMCGHPRIARLLLDHGADINLSCRYGKTPVNCVMSDDSDDWDDSVEDYDLGEDRDYDEDDENYYGEDDEDDYDEDDEDDYDENDEDVEDDEDDDDAEDDDYYEDDGYENYDDSSHDVEEDAYNSDDSYTRFDEVSDVIYKHVIKMVAMNRPVIDKNLRTLGFVFHFYKNLHDTCIREIECMRQKKIGDSNISYYDVLTNDINRLAVYARNEDIVDALETGDPENMFYQYLDMLKVRFKKGQKRAGLLDASLKTLSFLTGCALPDLSTGKIFNYLSNKDLENLIKAGPYVESDR